MTEGENAVATRRCLTEAATAGETGGRESAAGCEGQRWLCCAGGVSDLALWSEVRAEDTVLGVIRI